MDIFTAFLNGNVEGISEKPEKTVDTLLSKLFFTPQKVFKIYKAEKNSFEDFSDFKTRKDFCVEDFFWNREVSPSVYLALRGVKKRGACWVSSSMVQADDFYIEMNRVDDTQNFSDLLLQGNFTDHHLVQIANALTQKHITLTDKNRDGLADLFKYSLRDLILETSEDQRRYGYFCPNISNEWTDYVVDTWKDFVKKENYFSSFDSSNFQVSTDNHAKNILLLNGEIVQLDVFLPKRIWRVVDPIFNIARIATDVVVLAGRQKADIIYKTYKKFSPLPSQRIISFYEIYCSFILTAYCQYIKEPGLSDKYRFFIDNNLSKLL